MSAALAGMSAYRLKADVIQDHLKGLLLAIS